MDDKNAPNKETINIPTKQRILTCALDLFRVKGYSETTIRDIATAVGITPGTIYSHFSSKEELLQYMLNDYSENTGTMFTTQDVMSAIDKNPTSEGIMACIMESISDLTNSAYYTKLMHLVHQEQLRNDLFGALLMRRFYLSRDYIIKIFDALKQLNIIDADVNSEHWGVLVFSLLHTIATCAAVDKRLNTKGYLATDIAKILRTMFNNVLAAHKTPDAQPDTPKA